MSRSQVHSLLHIALVLALLASLQGCIVVNTTRPTVHELNLSTTAFTESGRLRVTYEPEGDTVPINRIHSWALKVESATGEPVENAHIIVDGDMPEHGHGLPTTPSVTRELGGGRYLLEGVKFQMGGWWIFDVTIATQDFVDTIRFNLLLPH